MGKLLAFLLALLALYLLRRALTRPKVPPAASTPPPPPGVTAERMVECAHCGLHVPESEAVSAAGRSFCSDAHRRAHLG